MVNIGTLRVLITNEINSKFIKTNTDVKAVQKNEEETRNNVENVINDVANIKTAISTIEELNINSTSTSYTLEKNTSTLLINKAKDLIIS